MRPLAGKRILFIGIGFYDYEAAIQNGLEDIGASVWFFLEQPRWHQSSLMRRIASLFGISIAISRERYLRRLLERVSSMTFDYVFVIKGEMLSDTFVSRLKAANRNAKFILYQWDSIRRVPGVEKLLPYFDRVLSFDRLDCLHHEDFVFRPLFYRDPPERQGHEPPISYDLTFIGWLHSDRFSRLLEIEAELGRIGVRSHIYLYTGIGTYLRYMMRGKRGMLHIRKLSFEKMANIIAASKCVLDLPHAEQNGLTMRTIEAIGMRRKLVTTNMDIVNYDFFDRQIILPMRQLNAAAIAAFVKSSSPPVPYNVLRGYSMNSWLAEVFDLPGVSDWQPH